jgi:hypothetical protein
VYYRTQHSIRHPPVQKFPKVPVVEVVEKSLNVGIYYKAATKGHQPVPQCLKCIVRPAPRPESVRAFHEVLLVDCFQHHRHPSLQDFVLQRWNANGPRAPVALRNVHPSHGRRVVRARLEPVEQRLKVVLQVLLVLGPCLPVHSRRPILAPSPGCLRQPLQVDTVMYRPEAALWVFPCQLRYAFESR